MKFCRIARTGTTGIGVVHPNDESQIIDVERAWEIFHHDAPRGDSDRVGGILGVTGSLEQLLAAGQPMIDAVREVVDWVAQNGDKASDAVFAEADCSLLAALQPPIVIASGMNFMSHLDEQPPMGYSRERPRFFLKAPNTVIGTGETFSPPPDAQEKFDYEVELGIVIGRRTRDVTEDEAWDSIFGYVVTNDATERSLQIIKKEDGSYTMDVGRAKNFAGSCPVGPYVVTRDVITDPHNLWMKTTVNDEVRQDGSTAQMIWKVNEIVAYFSTFLTLEPGTLILTGTPAGTAWGSDPIIGGRRDTSGIVEYLRSGDRVACSIEGLGTVENTVA